MADRIGWNMAVDAARTAEGAIHMGLVALDNLGAEIAELREAAIAIGEALSNSVVETRAVEDEDQLRDTFAIAALPAVVTFFRSSEFHTEIAKLSYRIADAMVAERRRRREVKS